MAVALEDFGLFWSLTNSWRVFLQKRKALDIGTVLIQFHGQKAPHSFRLIKERALEMESRLFPPIGDISHVTTLITFVVPAQEGEYYQPKEGLSLLMMH